MSTTAPAPPAAGRRRLSAWGIAFLVVSAAAPLTVVVSAAPMDFRLGGIGAPGAMLLCGAVLLLFAFGFTAMTLHVPNAGAFYAYARHGLGRGAGVGLALVTLFSYVFLNLAFYAFIGFFGSMLFENLWGIAVPWWACALVAALGVGILGARQVDVGAKVLAVLVTAEVAILLVLAVAVLVQGGPEPVSGAGFDPAHVLFGGGIAALLVIGFGAYLGFEGTAIYAEEARDPDRTVPKATYAVVAGLALFYAFTFWILTVAFGVDGVIAFALGDGFADMVPVAATGYLGAWAGDVISVLIVTSFLACALSFHNASTRYVFSLAREGLLPRRFKRLSARTQAPVAASVAISALAVAALVVAALTIADPYLGLALWTYATGVQGLVFSQAVAAIAVVAYFARDRRGHSLWRVLVAPALGAAGLCLGFVLIVSNFEITSGMQGWVNALLIAPTPILFLAGFAVSAILRRTRPQTWEELGRADQERQAHGSDAAPATLRR
ncbi:APC family permease [Galactobacter valiniphilus]|uniref:APC family permease n=1 Tax=Galactobacter valiniphilus TaxID=2676122 RepID=UPI003734DE41